MTHKKEAIVLIINKLTNPYSATFLDDLYQLLAYRQKIYAKSLMDAAAKSEYSPLKSNMDIELYQSYGILKDKLFRQLSTWKKEQQDDFEEIFN